MAGERDAFTVRAAHRGAAPGVLALAIGACSFLPVSDDATLRRQTYPKTAVYRAWWTQIERCSELTGDYDDLRFFVAVSPVTAGGRRFPCGGGALCNGVWEAPHDITLAPAYLEDERLVKHEMLHDLLGASGHPPVFEACDVDWVDEATR